MSEIRKTDTLSDMDMNKKMERMKWLAQRLREASRSYYALDREIMSNFEYDSLYDELEALEKETGIVLAQSPTTQVGYEAVDELPKERHERPMLSLDKTKDPEVLRAFIGDKEALLSWKLDGLTVVLTYRDGTLAKAVTRGNGQVGEVITANAKAFWNLPLNIPFKGNLVLRGEAVISYSDFEKVNASISDPAEQYKNPRNLCSGSVRQLDAAVTAKRHVQFHAFSLVSAEGMDFDNSVERQFEWLLSQGFSVVDHVRVTGSTLLPAIEDFSRRIENFDLPSDGLVVVFDDIAYGLSLGATAKFPRNSMAFKWKDEIKETTLLDVEWSASRTGLINPIAVFEPVELEGTTVSRASLHNVSYVRALKLGIGDRITVYKANMIIPQIAENLTCSDTLTLPETCPVCGGRTKVVEEGDTSTLECTNPQCMAKKIKSLSQFVSRDAMNVDGLSEATLEKLVSAGCIHTFADVFRLHAYRDTIINMEGMGEKSYNNLLTSLEKASHTTLPRLVFALGIANIGSVNAMNLCRAFDYDIEKLRTAGEEELCAVDGIGAVTARAVYEYFRNTEQITVLDELLEVIHLEKPEAPAGASAIGGKTFVITGSVHIFANRSELKAYIEERGGKVGSSVTAKTDYLINNDSGSTSSKNKKARELGIPVLTEEEFMEIAGSAT